MATNTPVEIVQSYADLLIMQYLNKPNASGTISAVAGAVIMPQTSVQEITFSPSPSSGAFVLSYDSVNSASINWDDPANTIQSKLRAITGLSQITVSGSIATGLTITFVGVFPPALMLELESSTLLNGSTDVAILIEETDVTLPIAVQDAFNLVEGTTTATGVQLDILGQYAGVTRTGQGFTTQITLDDEDYLQFIRMAIIKNSAGSSLATIQDFVNMFFPGLMFVIDNADMTMTYLISEELGAPDLLQLFITEGILPVPMAVRYFVIYGPGAEYFTFSTYEHGLVNGFGFNTYEDYQEDEPWIRYENVIFPL